MKEKSSCKIAAFCGLLALSYQVFIILDGNLTDSP